MRIKSLLIIILMLRSFASFGENIHILSLPASSNRVQFGVETLSKSLREKGYDIKEMQIINLRQLKFSKKENTIIVFEQNNPNATALFTKLKINPPSNIKKEGFHIETKGKITIVCGADGNGSIYGCREITDRQQNTSKLNLPTSFTDAPEMVMRGTCIGLQKTTYLPGHTVYEYPYTPENFPWFYDKTEWIKYLDMLVANRMNSLYLWNGHPFASLVKLKDYPFAVEVDDETFKKNEEIYSFLTKEADKRGIFIIQMFYNIIVSKPFADYYGIKTQDRNRPITPLISDYTRKSIAAFVEKYPNIGFLITLGEAMASYEDDMKWFTETIIPGVKDGLKALGRTDEPPVILRGHDTDAKMVIEASKSLYKNIYTVNKYTGESLTTYEPRGPWAQTHQDLSHLVDVHISNVHILANLEPFRWGSPFFVQKTVNAMHNVHNANGLHLYPQASYWDYPYTADKLEDGKRLKQIDRDWIWNKTWARYAWNCHREREDEIKYWDTQFGDFYGVNNSDAEKIQIAYDESGEIAPKLLRRFGITEGNRQTLLLGMTMSQLVNPHKYTIYYGFYESCGPDGEKLIEYVEKEWKKLPHIGELPLDIIEQAIAHGDKAVDAIDEVKGKATKNTDEFERLRNDMYCYREFAYFFNYKVQAAKLVLDYQWGNNIQNLENAIPLMEKSLIHYAKLVNLTKNSYLYANSMQTGQRRIPVGGDGGKNKTWEELYLVYQKEFENYKINLELLKSKQYGSSQKTLVKSALPASKVKIIGNITTAKPQVGCLLYNNIDSAEIKEIAPELLKLDTWILNSQSQSDDGTSIEFETIDSVQLLVGFFRDDQRKYAKAPTLETDASANLYGQSDPLILNAVKIDYLPAVNIHAYKFEKGHHKITLPKGLCLVFGFTSSKISARDARLTKNGTKESLDWMFY